MKEIICSNCQQKLILNENLHANIFCNYCGSKLSLDLKQLEEEQKLAKKIEEILQDRDPVRIHYALQDLEKKFPNNLAIQRALLLQGRLHERNPKKLDYSVIHCYLLQVFLEPESLTKEQTNAFLQELTSGERLLTCLSLSPDKNQFLQDYYEEMSGRFIDLFLLGSSKYMRAFFGLSMSRNPAKTLASPVAKMIENIWDTHPLADYRFVLAKALFQSFQRKFENITFLKDELGAKHLKLLDEYKLLEL